MPFTTEDLSDYVQNKLLITTCQGDLLISAAKLTQIDVKASGIPDAMTGALADLIEEEVAGSSAMPLLGPALRLSGRCWLTAGRRTVVLLLVCLSVDQPAPGPTDLWKSDVMGTGVTSCKRFPGAVCYGQS